MNDGVSIAKCNLEVVEFSFTILYQCLSSDPGEFGLNAAQYTADMLAGSTPHKHQTTRPVYRVLDQTGKVLDTAQVPNVI